MGETLVVQERLGHGRHRRKEVDDDLGNIKVNIPPFMGKVTRRLTWSGRSIWR